MTASVGDSRVLDFFKHTEDSSMRNTRAHSFLNAPPALHRRRLPRTTREPEHATQTNSSLEKTEIEAKRR
jgi:hypothetical protein